MGRARSILTSVIRSHSSIYHAAIPLAIPGLQPSGRFRFALARREADRDQETSTRPTPLEALLVALRIPTAPSSARIRSLARTFAHMGKGRSNATLLHFAYVGKAARCCLSGGEASRAWPRGAEPVALGELAQEVLDQDCSVLAPPAVW